MFQYVVRIQSCPCGLCLWTGRQTDKHKQMGGVIVRYVYEKTDRHTDRQMDTWVEWKMDRKMDKQTDKWIGEKTDRWMDRWSV